MLENNTRRRKVFQACISCRSRKTGCDGNLPQCSGCANRGLQCDYEVIRKMRGLGKKDLKITARRVSLEENTFRKPAHLSDNETNSIHHTRPSEEQIEIETEMTEDTTHVRNRLMHIFPEFLHPETTLRPLNDLKWAVQKDQKSPEGFAPLVSLEVVQYMLEHTYEDVVRICPIFELSTVLKMSSEQQAVSNTHPTGNWASWAILSTWISLAMHLKTVLEAKDKFEDVIKGFCRNAILVIPDLLLQAPSLETIQALLFMAINAEVMDDHRFSVMLMTNASRQIELLTPNSSVDMDSSDMECWERIFTFAQAQETKAARRYGVSVILQHSCL